MTTRVDDILDLIDGGLQSSWEPGYGDDFDTDRCARCRRSDPVEGGDLCLDCRAYLLGDSDDDPTVPLHEWMTPYIEGYIWDRLIHGDRSGQPQGSGPYTPFIRASNHTQLTGCQIVEWDMTSVVAVVNRAADAFRSMSDMFRRVIYDEWTASPPQVEDYHWSLRSTTPSPDLLTDAKRTIPTTQPDRLLDLDRRELVPPAVVPRTMETSAPESICRRHGPAPGGLCRRCHR